MSDFAAMDIDGYVQIMATRVDLAINKAAVTIFTVLDATLFYANTIQSRGLCASSNALEMAQDAADEAAANAQQLSYFAAQLKWPNVLMFDTIITIADPFMFNSVVHTNWLPVIITQMDVDIETCLRVVSSAIQPALCEFSGQGLTTFDPSGSDKQNVIHMVLRDEDNTIADWVTIDDIHLKLSTQCVLAGLQLSYTLDFDNHCWKVMYSVSGANMGTHIKFSIEILNMILRQCNVQVM